MAADQGEQYKNALKATEQIIANQKAIKEGAEGVKEVWNQISSTLFGLSSADYFEEVPKTTGEIIKQQEALADMNENVKKLETGFIKAFNQNEKISSLHTELLGAMVQPFQAASISSNSFFQGALQDIKSMGIAGVNSEEELIKLLNGELALTQDIVDSIKQKRNYQKLEQAFLEKKSEYDRDTNAKLAEAIKENKILASMAEDDALQVARKLALTGDLDEATKDLTHSQRESIAAMIGDENLVRMNIELNQAKKGFEAMTEEAKKATKETFSLGKAIKSAAKNITKDWVQSIVDFDSTIHQIQRDTGILMDSFENSQAFAKITADAALFGMELKDAAEYMSGISDALNTTDFGTVAGAFKDLQAVEGATGAARQDIIGMTGEMMRMGSTSEQVKDAFQDIDKSSRMFGVSSRKTIADISKNLGKFKNFGFQGGEKSLKNMVITAQRLRANVDEIFDFTTKARTIEGAMDMAASLQLAGGSFSKLNPMDLLSAARKGPKEMTKILAEMGSDIGKFNAKGEFEIDPIDADRLQMVSEATGLSLETLRNSIESTAMQNAKLKMFPESMFEGAIKGIDGVDKDFAKSALGDMLERGKDGKITIKEEFQEKFGTKDITKINESTLNAILKEKQLDAKSIEEQNKRNQSFKEAMANLVNGLMSTLAVFQPIVEVLGGFFKFLGGALEKAPMLLKVAIALFLVGVSGFGASVLLFISKGVGGMVDNIKSLKGIFKEGGFFSKMKSAFKGGGEEVSGGAGASNTINNIKGSVKKALGGIKSFIGDTLNFFKDIFAQFTKFLTNIFNSVADLIINVAKKIISGVNSILTGLSKTVDIVGKIVGKIVNIVSKSFVTVMSSLGAGITSFATAAAAGFTILTPFIPIIIVLTGVIIGLAFAFKLLMDGLASLAPLVTALMEGMAVVVESIGVAVSTVISTIADSIVKIASIDGGNLFVLAGGIAALSAAMVAFGASSLISGAMNFLGGGGPFDTLFELATIAPQFDSLSKSINNMSDGIDRLGEAADRLSLEKLEELKDLTSDLSTGGISFAAIAGSLSELAGKLGGSGKGSGGGGSENRTITVNLKLNGRDIQSVIIDDTEVIK